jgi:hypothetical protein
VGPLPQGTYTLGNMYTFKGMPYCYDLYPSSSNNMCGRSGFLIHGGNELLSKYNFKLLVPVIYQ